MTAPDDMTAADDVTRAEGTLRQLLGELTDPHEGECLFCYVYRVLQFGCLPGRLPWARRWRDLRAPRATGLERRLEARAGFCDCEIFLNGWCPRDLVLDDNGDDPYPPVMPACRGVRRGSTQPCSLWVPKPRDPFGY
jgi:Protein of unknown function (DUF2695)